MCILTLIISNRNYLFVNTSLKLLVVNIITCAHHIIRMPHAYVNLFLPGFEPKTPYVLTTYLKRMNNKCRKVRPVYIKQNQ